MPRYRFDVTDGGKLTRDGSGIDLADDAEAREEAIALCAHIARDVLPDGDHHEIKVEARNGGGDVVFEATLSLDGRWWPGRR